MKRILIVGLLLLTVSACGDDTPTGSGIPDVTGEWVGSWVFVAQGGGSESPITTECEGSIDFTTQTGGAVTGNALIGGDRCSFPPLPFDGEVGEDGSVTFTLDLVTGCTITDGGPDFTGVVDGNDLVVTNSVTADCTSGTLSVSTRFAGSRAP